MGAGATGAEPVALTRGALSNRAVTASETRSWLPRSQQVRVAAWIEELAKEPRPSRTVKLAGAEDLWRARVGDSRIVYQVSDERWQVLVVLVGRRGDIYGRLRDL